MVSECNQKIIQCSHKTVFVNSPNEHKTKGCMSTSEWALRTEHEIALTTPHNILSFVLQSNIVN